MQDEIFKEVFTVVILVFAFAMIVGSIAVGSTDSCTNITTSSSANQTIFTSSYDTIAPIGDGITSFNANANNQTWLDFDGVNDYINSSKIYNYEYNDTYAICFWAISYESVVKSGVMGRNVRDYFYSESGNLVWQYYNGTSSLIVLVDGIINNNWYSVCGINNGTHRNYYLNGIYNKTLLTPTSSSIKTNDDFNIGRHSPDYFNGGIDEVRIYNRSLSSLEVSEIYNSGRIANSSLPSNGLVLWYAFDENSDTTVHDLSGNGNDGI